MLLFVGLGNPGPKHVGNRHNIGFMAVQAIARRHDLSPWRRRFQGVSVEGSIDAERVLLLLPGTYMNESGRAVAEAANFYKRVRIGIGKPEVKELVPMHVLGDFVKNEWAWVEALCDVIAENAALLIEGKDSTFQNRVHLAMTAKGFDEDEEPPGSD